MIYNSPIPAAGRYTFLSRKLLLFSAIFVLACAQGWSEDKGIPAPKSLPYTDQHIALLFAGQGNIDRIILTLNNNRAESLSVTPTLYRLGGQAVKLPAIELKQSESKLIELGESLRQSGVQGEFGYMDLSYSGRLMELGAQLTLYPVFDKGGLDSPRSLSGDFKSTERAAIAWLPQGSEAVVAVTNVSAQTIPVHLLTGEDDARIVVGPHETLLRNMQFDRAAIKVLAVDVNYDGPVDAIRVFGYVKNWTRGSFPIRFSDPAASTGAHLTAIGLRTNLPTHIAVNNLGDKPVEYHLHFVEIDKTTPRVVDTPPAHLQAHSGDCIPVAGPLQQMADMGIERATLTLMTDADSKSIVAAATQEIQDALLEDVPFRPSNPRGFMRGAYPLRWSRDYTNHPMIANVSSVPMTVRAYVIAGGITYAFPLREVQPDTTTVFDVDQVREMKTPDVKGKLIPMDAVFGKFHWAPMVNTTIAEGLSGRTEVYSAENKRASSFSCNFICDYEYDEYPLWDTDLTGMYQAPNLTGARTSTGTEYVMDGYGNVVNYPITDPYKFGNPHFDTTSILSANVLSNNTMAQADTGNYGSTTFHYAWEQIYGVQSEDGSYCMYPDTLGDGGGASQVPACATPEGESTQYVRQALADPIGAPTASDFLQTLTSAGNDDGNSVIEANNANGTDACYFSGSSFSGITGVSGTTWLIGGITPGYPESQVVIAGHNQWGPDVIGYSPGAVRYYQQNRAKLGLPLPCGFSLQQNLTISCTQDESQTTYKANNSLTSTIDSTGITNCRSGVCSPHTNYQ